MFDEEPEPRRGLPTAVLAAWVDTLAGLEPAVDDAERIDQIALLERLKAASAAAQARVTADLAAGQRRILAETGVDRAGQARSIGAQVALARRESPVRGNRHLGVAEALVHEMPATFAALQRGDLSEWRATVLVRETACLSRSDRTLVDAELGPRLPELGDKQVADESRKIAYRLDPASVMRRIRGAESDRRVSLRPAPDAMSYLTGFLPAAQGVAAQVALRLHADAAKAAGDRRSRGQIMADELVARLTGRAPASDVEIQLLMTDTALFGQSDEAATLVGLGPLPAMVARRLVREADEHSRIWLRRLYTAPETGALVAMESRRRTFEHGLRQYLVARDEICRTPWCGAPIRHLDHVVEHHDGGATSAGNGQGLCESCNYVKQAPGWSARPDPSGTVRTTTPTGHVYTSGAPPLRPPERPLPVLDGARLVRRAPGVVHIVPVPGPAAA